MPLCAPNFDIDKYISTAFQAAQDIMRVLQDLGLALPNDISLCRNGA